MMKRTYTQISETVNSLTKGTDFQANLPIFVKDMKDTASVLSGTRFSMNYLVFWEMLSDCLAKEIQVSAVVLELWNRFTGLTKKTWGDGNEESVFVDGKDALKEVSTLKDESTAIMKELVNLSGHGCILEYCMNRKEYDYRVCDFKDGFSDEGFTETVMKYIVGKKEDEEGNKNTDMQMIRTTEIVEQLPLRMTKLKFSQLLRDGMSVYAASEKESLLNLMDSVRTNAALTDINANFEHFPFITEKFTQLEQMIGEIHSAEAFEKASADLNEAIDVLNDMIDLMMLFQELVNDYYVMALTDFDVLSGEDEAYEVINTIISEINGLMNTKDGWGGLSREECEKIEELYPNLEGIQEQLYGYMAVFDSSFEEILQCNNQFIEADDKCKSDLVALFNSKLLLSTSLYADLKTENDLLTSDGEKEMCDAEFVEESFNILFCEISDRLQKVSREMKKATMAKVLAQLPPFLRKYETLKDYVLLSLQACDNEAEKWASVEIIRGMMFGE